MPPTPFPEPQMIPNSNHPTTPKKRHRSATSSRSISTIDISDHHDSAGTLMESSSQLPNPRRNSSSAVSAAIAGGFNDAATADVLLRLYSLDNSDNLSGGDFDFSGGDCDFSNGGDLCQVYLHSSAISRAKYFSASLSDRWSSNKLNNDELDRKRFRTINLGVSKSTGSIQAHLNVLQLLYSDDFSTEIQSVSSAIAIVPIAMNILFEDCVRYCVRFLEAVPWSEEEEEEIVMNLAPFLSEDESKELLARVSTSRGDSCERMLHNLLLSAKQNHPNMAPMKAFVARLLREFSSRDSARSVLEKAFSTSLKVVKDSLEEYSSPKIRGDHNETEAIQRLNLHTALTNGKHLLWLIERMIELRVADMAVKEWSEQDSLAADLQRAFRDDAWRNIVPGLPTVVLKCTSKLASAVAAGTILVARQVRMKLVKDWLPVLIVCKDTASPMLHSPKSLYLELEETFLRIISTLPMDDSQELLQQCLSFSTRDSEDCPHLITAFNTWFRRASRPRQSN